MPRRRRCRSSWLYAAAEIRLDEIPGDFGSDRPAAHAEHVHVVILHALLRREVVVDERGADARDLVGADRRADAASADGHAAFDRPRHDGAGERDHEVRIVVVRVEGVGAEIDDPCPAERRCATFSSCFAEAAVIGRDSDAHRVISSSRAIWGDPAAARSARIRACPDARARRESTHRPSKVWRAVRPCRSPWRPTGDAPGAIENRIGEGHPPALIHAGECHVGVGDIEHGIEAPVRPCACRDRDQMTMSSTGGEPAIPHESRRVALGCRLEVGRVHGHGMDLSGVERSALQAFRQVREIPIGVSGGRHTVVHLTTCTCSHGTSYPPGDATSAMACVRR